MKFKTLTRSEITTLAKELLEEIEKRKEIVGEHFIKKVYISNNERISYENIDMTDIEEELLTVLYNYHSNSNYNLGYQETKVIEKVCLAAMCQFIKGHYHIKGYTRDYTNLTNLQFDSRLYRILENSFKIEKILPANWNSMKGYRYKDTLINETGIPKHLIRNLIDLFETYWKNLREFDFEYVFENHDNINLSKYIWDVNERLSFEENIELLKEYPRKVNKVVKQLSDVCALLEEGDYYEEDLSSSAVIDGINSMLKFDMFNILHRRSSLKALYIEIISKVSVNKFHNIIRKSPIDTKMTTPNNEKILISKYRDVKLGIHNIYNPINKIYTVLPQGFLSINSMKKYKEDEFIEVNENYIAYRKDKPFNVYIGKNIVEISYPLFEKGKVIGHYFVGKVKNGVPVKIDNQIYEPDKFINYTPLFKYYYNYELSTYSYNLILRNLKFYLKIYAKEDIYISCNYSDHIKSINIDKDGFINNKSISFNLNKEIGEEPVSIYIYHKNKDKLDLLFSDEIERIDDVNKYTRNLKRNKIGRTDFNYKLRNRDWKHNDNLIFHIEDVCNPYSRVVTNLKEAENEVEIVAQYHKKYKKLRLSDVITKKNNMIYLSHEKLRDVVAINDNDSAKINLVFIYKSEKIFETTVISVKNIEINLDKDLYEEGEEVVITVRYRDNVNIVKSTAKIVEIDGEKSSALIPVSIYIEEIDGYYTQYVKPNVVKDEKLKWYEIEGIYSEDDLKKDVLILGQYFNMNN